MGRCTELSFWILDLSRSKRPQLRGLLRKDAGHCPGEITGPRQSRKSRLAIGWDTKVLGDSGSMHLNIRKSYPF